MLHDGQTVPGRQELISIVTLISSWLTNVWLLTMHLCVVYLS